jgi:hypothetical protein
LTWCNSSESGCPSHSVRQHCSHRRCFSPASSSRSLRLPFRLLPAARMPAIGHRSALTAELRDCGPCLARWPCWPARLVFSVAHEHMFASRSDGSRSLTPELYSRLPDRPPPRPVVFSDAGSSNGKTPASGVGYRGSSPCPAVTPRAECSSPREHSAELTPARARPGFRIEAPHTRPVPVLNQAAPNLVRDVS